MVKSFWTIKHKLLIFLFSVSLVPITVITLVYYLTARKELILQINQKMTAVAESKKLHVEAFLNAIKGRGVDFGSDGFIRNKLDKINREKVYKQDNVKALCKHLKENKMPLDPDIAAITILGNSGMVVASTVESIIGKDFSSHNWFISTVEKNSIGACSFHQNFSEHMNHGSLEVAVPITSMKSSDTIGVLINVYQQEIVNNITSNHKGMGESGEIVIGMRDGNTIQFLNSLRYVPENTTTLQIPLADEAAEPMRMALEGHYGTVVGPDYRGTTVIAAYQHIPSIGWGMVAKMDKTEAFRPLRFLSVISFTLAGVSSITVICVGIIFTNRATKPINELTYATDRFANGELDYIIAIDQNDEVGILAKSFNDMAKKLSGEITEHKHSKDELIASNKELEAFCYSVSHDLRTPLRSIEGFSGALLDVYAENLDTQAKDYFGRIQRATRHMNQLIDDLLNLSRINRNDMKYETVDMRFMAQEIMEELRGEQPERQVEFVVSREIKAEGDKRLLKIALDNLLGNAWKFTGKHKCARIEFGVTHDDGNEVYFLSDDGAGFEMIYVDKLFTAFQRLHGKEEFDGTGIGLATVQRIIHRHGGRIWAEGEVGHGATFYFTL